jgi:ABC-2 type transport system ATP-binding protein
MTSASAEPFAVLVGARKRYGKIVALDGLDLDVRPAELLAVLGPNGAGKTTAIGMLLGLIAPDSGTARLFGRPPTERAARRHIGVMMQEVYPAPELRVREQIDLTANAYAEPLAVDAVLERVGIAALADRPYRRLSVGQKRQV